MNERNFYESPGLVEEVAVPSAAQGSSVKRLWFAFGVTPPLIVVCYGLFSIASAIVALGLMAPDDPGTPAGLFLLPIMVFFLGTPTAYLGFLALGMPTVFWLRGRGQLNLKSLNIAGVSLCFLIATTLSAVGAIGERVDRGGAMDSQDIQQALIAWGGLLALLVPGGLIGAPNANDSDGADTLQAA